MLVVVALVLGSSNAQQQQQQSLNNEDVVGDALRGMVENDSDVASIEASDGLSRKLFNFWNVLFMRK